MINITEIARGVLRRGKVFMLDQPLSDKAGVLAFSFGRIKGLTLTAEPIEGEADTTGQTAALGYNFTAQFSMMQTKHSEIEAAGQLSEGSFLEDYPDYEGVGVSLFVSNQPYDLVQAETHLTTEFTKPDADNWKFNGFFIDGAIIKAGPQINFSAEESEIVITITGRLAPDFYLPHPLYLANGGQAAQWKFERMPVFDLGD